MGAPETPTFKRDRHIPLQNPKGCIYPLKLPGGAPRTLVSERITHRYATPSITRDIREFRPNHLGISKPEPPLRYIRDRPESSPTTPKPSTSPIWLFLSEGACADTPIMYIPGRGWCAYHKCWVENYGNLVHLTAPAQATFPPAIQKVRSIAVSRNLLNARTKGGQGARSKYITDLECELSDSFKIQGLAENAGHFFAREAPMGADPFLLRLQNATVDIRGNVIRPISPFDYVTKMSHIAVPVYSIECESLDGGTRGGGWRKSMGA